MAVSDTPFGHALIEDIIPFVDANLRTLADQRHRGLAGRRHYRCMRNKRHGRLREKGHFVVRELREQRVRNFRRSNGPRGPEERGRQQLLLCITADAQGWQSWRRSLHEFAQLAFQK